MHVDTRFVNTFTLAHPYSFPWKHAVVQLQAAQILQGQMQSVGQSGATSQAPVTLVKSVAAPAGTSGVPIPVSINVTMGQGQQKTGLCELLFSSFLIYLGEKLEHLL